MTIKTTYKELNQQEKNLFNDIESLSNRIGDNSFNKVLVALLEKRGLK